MPEAEKPRRCITFADRKVFARLESFCAYLQNWLKIKSKHNISLESFQTVWKVSGQTGKFLDDLESTRTAWKVFGQSGRFPTNLETPEVCYSTDKITKVSHQQSLQN